MGGRQLLRRLGLAGICIAVGATLAGTPPAHATAPPLAVQQMAGAIGKLQSYKLTEDARAISSAQTSLFSNMHFVAIFVQKGKIQESHVTMQVKVGNSWKMLIELVTNTKHSCERGPLLSMFSSSKSSAASTTRWTCSTNKKSLGMSNTNPADVVTNISQYSFTALKQMTVQGQLCDGFTIRKNSTGDTEKGSLWLNSVSHLLVEVDFVQTQSQGAGSRPSVSTIKVVLSNANDPGLTIPAI